MKKFMKKILSRRILFFLSLVAGIWFSFVMFKLQVLPIKFYVLMVVVLLLIILGLYKGQKDKNDRHPIRVTLLKLLNIVLAVALVFGSLKVMEGSNFLESITGGSEQIIEMNVAVLKSSSYDKIADLKEKVFGANTKTDPININTARTKIEEEIDTINMTSYTSDATLLDDLKSQTIDAMIIGSTQLEALDDIETDVTDTLKIVKKIEIKVPKVEATSAKVTKEPFNIFISGTDKEGPISTFALSDVNMIVTINPETKQVLLTSIPRDYFVDIIGMDNVSGKDKLTHSAKGGINCTLETVENFMGIKFNYYAKFNFTSFMNVIDELGGIEIDVPKYKVIGNDEGRFKTKKGNNGKGYVIEPGKQTMNADKALAFVRERKSFVDGDNIRGQNQMLMVKAIIKKCCSPSIITNMTGVFESLENSFETNMSSQDIKSLINMQIDTMTPWDVQTYHLEGDPSQRTLELATVGDITKVNPRGAFITVPYDDSIAQAKGYIEQMMNGEIVKAEKYIHNSSASNSTSSTE